MKVFISWSGTLSQQVAAAFNEWLPQVLHAVEPFFSDEDIDKGTRWSQTIARELEGTSVGLFCVTRENLDSRWLNFEAGAISKLLSSGRVMPFLFGLKKSEVQWPLADFQMTVYERDDLWKLVSSINRACTPPCVDEGRLFKSFERWWPDLNASLESLLVQDANATLIEQPSRPVSSDDILEELLELLREQHKVIMSQELRLRLTNDNSSVLLLPREDLLGLLKSFRWLLERMDRAYLTKSKAPIPDVHYARLTEASQVLHAVADLARIDMNPLILKNYRSVEDRALESTDNFDDVPF